MDDEIQLEKELEELKDAHTQVDIKLRNLSDSAFQDQLMLTRLKREKLRLKDEIFRISDMLYPDMPA